jgi:hypothetical protein
MIKLYGTFGTVLGALALLAGTALPAAAQAAIEAGMGASRAATTAAPAKTAGSVIGNLVDQAAKVLGGAGKAAAPADTGSPAVSTPAPIVGRSSRQPARTPKTPVLAAVHEPAAVTPMAPLAPAAPVYEDPAGILLGTEYQEVLRRFGPPSLSVTTQPGVQSLRYKSEGLPMKVQIRDGKVASVDAPRR